MRSRIPLHPGLLFCCLTLAASAQPGVQWQICLGGSDIDEGGALTRTNDGGYIVTGRAWSANGNVTGHHGGTDLWVVKLGNSGTLQWQKSFGGTWYEQGYAIIQTTDGGYMAVGTTQSSDGDVTNFQGAQDMWAVKLSSTGALQWQKALGGSNSEEAASVIQTSDGGYIIAGGSASDDGMITDPHGAFDLWVVKLGSSGALQWQKSFGGSGWESANSIGATSDGGWIVAGWTSSTDGDVTGNHGMNDVWVLKLSGSGALQWQKCLGGSADDEAHSIEQTPDGGYIIAGSTASTNGDVTGLHGSYDVWVVKLDATGNVQWQKCLGGTDFEEAGSIRRTSDGGYLIGGSTGSTDGDVSGVHGLEDVWIAKLDAAGTLQWQGCYGGSGEEVGVTAQPDQDGGTILAGWSNSSDGQVSGGHGNRDYWVAKLAPYQVGVQELETFDLLVSPNPAHALVRVSWPGSPDGFDVVLRDATGRTVWQGRSNDPSCWLDVSDKPAGPYWITLRDELRTRSQRLVITP